MADYSDEWNDIRASSRTAQIKDGIVSRLRGEGFSPVWKDDVFSWAVDHIQYLECFWCGVLVHDSRLHRNFCTGPLVGDPDIEPPPPPPLDLTPGV